MTLDEITANLQRALERYNDLPLDDLRELSEVLKILGVNLSYLSLLRDQYNAMHKNAKFNSSEPSEAAKTREADYKVQELEKIKYILRHFKELQNDIRTQINTAKQLS